MLVRFGFVAMSVNLENASPSKTITFTRFQKLIRENPEFALETVKKVAQENLTNTLRLLRHCKAYSVQLYRFSSSIIPLATHPELAHWDYIRDLKPQLIEIGEFIKKNNMRVTFHPDHFTLLNSPKEEVFKSSIIDLGHHCRILNTMKLDKKAKLIIHVGGGYSNKNVSLERFIENFPRVPRGIAKRLTLENDDKTFTANETLYLCEKLQLPMVLDIHHFRCNHEEGSNLEEIYLRFISTWKDTGLPPKVHISSPKSETNFRSHHDFINPQDIYSFLIMAREMDTKLDVMVEAKNKDEAMLRLVKELSKMPKIKLIDDGSIKIK